MEKLSARYEHPPPVAVVHHPRQCEASVCARALSWQLLGRYISLRDRQTLADANGKKTLVLIRKVLTFKPAFYFYTFAPNFDGRAATRTRSDAGVSALATSAMA